MHYLQPSRMKRKKVFQQYAIQALLALTAASTLVATIQTYRLHLASQTVAQSQHTASAHERTISGLQKKNDQLQAAFSAEPHAPNANEKLLAKLTDVIPQ
jgi:hypothetical protein